MPVWLGKIAKAWVAVGGAVVTGFLAAYPSTATWLPAVAAAITAVLVYIVPNAPVSTQIVSVIQQAPPEVKP